MAQPHNIQQVQYLRSQLQAMSQERSHQQLENGELGVLLKRLVTMSADQEHEIQENNNRILFLESDNQQLRNKCTAYQAQILNLQQQVESLDASLEKARTLLKQQVAQYQFALQTQHVALQQKIVQEEHVTGHKRSGGLPQFDGDAGTQYAAGTNNSTQTAAIGMTVGEEIIPISTHKEIEKQLWLATQKVSDLETVIDESQRMAHELQRKVEDLQEQNSAVTGLEQEVNETRMKYEEARAASKQLEKELAAMAAQLREEQGSRMQQGNVVAVLTDQQSRLMNELKQTANQLQERNKAIQELDAEVQGYRALSPSRRRRGQADAPPPPPLSPPTQPLYVQHRMNIQGTPTFSSSASSNGSLSMGLRGASPIHNCMEELADRVDETQADHKALYSHLLNLTNTIAQFNSSPNQSLDQQVQILTNLLAEQQKQQKQALLDRKLDAAPQIDTTSLQQVLKDAINELKYAVEKRAEEERESRMKEKGIDHGISELENQIERMRQEFENNREREKQLVYQHQVHSSQGTQCSMSSPTMSPYDPTGGGPTTTTATEASRTNSPTADINKVKDDLKNTKRQLQEACWRIEQKDMAIQDMEKHVLLTEMQQEKIQGLEDRSRHLEHELEVCKQKFIAESPARKAEENRLKQEVTLLRESLSEQEQVFSELYNRWQIEKEQRELMETRNKAGNVTTHAAVLLAVSEKEAELSDLREKIKLKEHAWEDLKQTIKAREDEIKELQNEIDLNKKRLGVLTEKCDSQRDKILSLESNLGTEVVEKRAETDKLLQRCISKEGEVTSLREHLVEKSGRVAELEANDAEQQRIIDELTNRTKLLQENLKVADANLRHAEHDKSQSETVMENTQQQLRAELMRFQQQLHQLQHSLNKSNEATRREAERGDQQEASVRKMAEEMHKMRDSHEEQEKWLSEWTDKEQQWNKTKDDINELLNKHITQLADTDFKLNITQRDLVLESEKCDRTSLQLECISELCRYQKVHILTTQDWLASSVANLVHERAVHATELSRLTDKQAQDEKYTDQLQDQMKTSNSKQGVLQEKISNLEDSLKVSADERVSLQHTIDKLEAQLETAESEMQNTEKKMQGKSREVLQRQNQVSELQNECRLLKENLNYRDAKISAFDETVDKLRDSIRDSEDIINKLKTELDLVTKEKGQLSERVTEKNNELNALKIKFEANCKEVGAIQQEKQSLLEKLTELTKTKDGLITQLNENSKVKRELEAACHGNQEASSTIRDLRGQLELKDHAQQLLTQQVQQLEVLVQSIEQQMEEARVKVRDSDDRVCLFEGQIQQLQADLIESEEQCANKQDEYTALEKKLEAELQTMQEMEKHRNDVDDTLNHLNKTIALLNSELNDKNAELSEMIIGYETEKAHKLRLLDDREILSQKLCGLEQDVADRDKHIMILNKQQGDLEGAFEDAKKSRDRTLDEKDQCVQRIQMLEMDVIDRDKQIAELTWKQAEAQQVADTEREKKQQVKEDKARVVEEKDASIKRIAMLEADVLDRDRVLRELEWKLQEYQDKIQALEDNNKRNSEYINGQQEKLDITEVERNEYSRRANEFEHELALLKDKFQLRENELKRKIKNKEKDIGEKDNKIETLKAKEFEQSATLQSLQQKLEVAEKEAKQVPELIDQLKESKWAVEVETNKKNHAHEEKAITTKRLQVIESDNEQKDKEIERLNFTLDNALKQAIEAQHELEREKLVTRKVNSLELDVDDRDKKLAELQKKLNDMQQQVDAERDNKFKIVEDKARVMGENDGYTKRLAYLENEINDKDMRLIELTKELTELQANLNVVSSMHAQSQSAVHQLEAELQDKGREHLTMLKQVEELEVTLRAVETQIDSEKVQMQNDIMFEKERNEGLEYELRVMKETHHQLELKLEDMRVVTNKVEELNVTIGSLTSDKDHLCDQLGQFKQMIDLKENELIEERSKFIKHQEEIADLEQKVNECNNAMFSQQRETEHVQSSLIQSTQVVNERDEQLRLLRDENSYLHLQLQTSDDLTDQNTLIKQMVDTLEGTVAEKQEEIEKMESVQRRMDSDYQELLQDKLSLQLELKETSTTMDDRLLTIQRLQVEMKDLVTQFELLQSNHKETENQLQSKCREFSERQEHLNTNNKEQNSTISTLNETNNQLEHDNRTQSFKIRELEDLIGEMEKATQSKSHQIANLQGALKTRTEEALQEKENATQLNLKVELCKTSHVDLADKLEKSESDAIEWRKRNRLLETELETTKNHNEWLVQEISRVRQQATFLEGTQGQVLAEYRKRVGSLESEILHSNQHNKWLAGEIRNICQLTETPSLDTNNSPYISDCATTDSASSDMESCSESSAPTKDERSSSRMLVVKKRSLSGRHLSTALNNIYKRINEFNNTQKQLKDAQRQLKDKDDQIMNLSNASIITTPKKDDEMDKDVMIDNLRDHVMQLESEVVTLRHRNAQLECITAQLNGDIQLYHEKCEKQGIKLDQLFGENVIQQHELDKTLAHVNDLSNRLGSPTRLVELEEDKHMLIHALKVQCANQQTEILELKDEIHTLHTEIGMREQMAADLQLQIERLAHRNASSDDQLSSLASVFQAERDTHNNHINLPTETHQRVEQLQKYLQRMQKVNDSSSIPITVASPTATPQQPSSPITAFPSPKTDETMQTIASPNKIDASSSISSPLLFAAIPTDRANTSEKKPTKSSRVPLLNVITNEEMASSEAKSPSRSSPSPPSSPTRGLHSAFPSP